MIPASLLTRLSQPERDGQQSYKELRLKTQFHKSFLITYPKLNITCALSRIKHKREHTLTELNGGEKQMVKCGICGGDVPRQPHVTDDGKCDQCNKKLEMAESEKSKK